MIGFTIITEKTKKNPNDDFTGLALRRYCLKYKKHCLSKKKKFWNL